MKTEKREIGASAMMIGAEFDDYLARCDNAKKVDDLKTIFGAFAKAEGFDNNVLTSIAERRLKSVAWYDFPAPYAEAYIENRWERDDPILSLSLTARRPFTWSQALQNRQLGRKQTIFMAESEGLKVRNGITFPMHGPNGRCEIFSISCREDTETNPERLTLIRAVATQTWWKYVDLLGQATFAPDANRSALTPRQRDVLLWIKDGKTNVDISEIMNVSVKTIEFHVSNILDKLGASNRITAVVIALQRGYL